MPKRANPAAVKDDSLAATDSAASRAGRLLLPQMTLEALEARVFLTVTGFQPAVNYTTGASPRAIATGDFTNNGRSDLVVVNQTSDTISVLMANANGTFGTPITLSDNASPNAVAVGDFLGNGDEDIAVTNQSTGTVSIYLGNGAGSFSSPATVSVGAGADAIVSADLNNDGRDDLAIGTFTAGNVVVLLANSNGTNASNAFTVSQSNTYSLGAGINGIAAGALTTDGYKDLAVTNVGGTVTILHNDQTGHFTTSDSDQYDAGVSPEGVVIGNFLEPGDIAIADNGDGTSGSANITVLLNSDGAADDYITDPNGPYLAGANPSSIVAADFNGDGKTDLAITDDTDNTVSLLYNTGSATGPIFAAPVTVATGQDPDAIATGDFLGNGLTDLAVANKTDGNASVLLQSSISVTGDNQTGTEGAALSGVTVATFTDNESNAVAGDFTAQINWGDGTTTTGTVASNGSGGFKVTGGHPYYNQGVYTMTITVTDTDNDSAQATASTVVADAALTPSSLTFTPTAGASFTGAVATFTDADPNGAAKFQANSNQYAAIIAWGDGHSTTGAITVNGSTFTVGGTHTYQTYGNFSAHVTIIDEGGSSTSTTSTADVADAVIAATGTTLTGTEGTGLSGTVGTFTDANTFMAAGAFTATLHWGDGNTTSGVVTKTGTGQFSITASHTYSNAGSYTLSFSVSDAGGSSSSTTTGITMSNAALTSTLATFHPVEGTAYTSTVATFTDANTLASASQFTAVITWPDSTTSSGTIAGSGGNYVVTIPGGYTFAHAGSQPVSVAITGGDGITTTTAQGDAGVYNATMAGTLATVTATEGVAFTGTLATFTDANTAASAADFTSTITWDDNSTSSATIAATGTPGTFAVTFPGGHTFTRTGNVGINVAIYGAGAGTADPAGNVYVANQTLTSTASTISASNGNEFSGAVATFSDPNTAASGADFSATIHWGDASSSSGTIVSNGSGSFTVTGTHTWANPGGPTVVVDITGNGGGSTSTSQAATVNDSPITVTGVSSTVTEGGDWNSTIATFTDANPSAAAGDFTSSIDWGDGDSADTSASIVSNGSGGFNVLADHTYSGAGAASVTVTVTDNNSQSVNAGSTINVGYAAVAGTLSTITATEGSAFSDTVATFTDANTSAPVGQFLATIAWPGGNSSSGTIAQTSPGNFSVTGGFTFTRAGTRPVSVTITDPTGDTTLATASGDATVASAGVTVTGGNFECLQGFGRTGTVATFADAYSGSITPASAYSATITWDDGSTSAGTIASTGSGTYSISAGHTFQTSGNGIAYSISVAGPGMGSAATATGHANVDSNSLTATMATITATEGTPFIGTIATLTNGDSLALNPGTDYTATITWDDSTTSAGTVTATSNGSYSITATHTFETPGTPTESISITGPRVFSSVTASGSATVANAGVTVTGGSIAPTEGTPFTGTVGTFADANAPTDLDGSAYTAAITWDDGTTTDGTAIARGGGDYSITATHTFNDAGNQSYSISVTGPGMESAATDNGAATVANAGITGTLATISTAEGAGFTGTVATFTDADALSTVPAGSYSATITWDDSTTSSGTIAALSDGTYSITAPSHTFQTPGNAAISISVTGPGVSSPLTITGDATVTAATLAVNGLQPTFTEGAASTNVTIATFTSADPGRVAGDFTATVDWGDGTGSDSSQTTIVTDTDINGFAVVASHTFAAAGWHTTVVHVTEGASYQTQSSSTQEYSGFATVSNPTIASITATEGTPWTGTIGTFTDSDTGAVTSEFAATIALADQSPTSAGISQISPGEFAVTLSGYTFPDAGNIAVALDVTDGANTLSSNSGTVFVSNAALSATGTTQTTTAGNDFTGPIATFTDANTLATAADFSATVDWGDSSTPSSGTDVTITQTSPGTFQIVSSHTYSTPADDTITISVAGAGGGSTTATTDMDVAVGTISIDTITSNATEGESFTNTVATFTDSNPQLGASDFAASVDWSDGSAGDTLAIVTTSTPGEFALVGTHTYDAAQGYWAHVVVQQNGTGNSGNNYTLVGVGYQDVAATLAPITGAEGSAFSGTVATFTDANTAAPASEFAATITWPDSSTAYGTVTQTSPGNFVVTASGYTFTSAADQTVSVAVTTPDHSTTLGSDSGSADVASAGVTATGGSINSTQGADFNNTVATFADSYTGTTTPANAYTATITWDDSSTSPGTIASLGNGEYSVTADHTFQTAGDVNYSISVAGPGMSSAATDTGSATVTSAAITATLAPISTTEGTSFARTVATFTNADTSALNPASDYSATITWDDGSTTTTSTGDIVSTGNGGYAISAAHIFNTPGNPTESISITGPGMASPATASGSATIANAGITVTGGSITPTQGTSFTGAVGTFIDANSNTTLAGTAYTATVTWADSSTSPGTITALGGGNYSIAATNTFQSGGSQAYSISVTGPGLMSPATGAGSATIANAGVSSGGYTIDANEGSAFSGAIVSFNNSDSSATDLASAYSASIHWGDGLTSAGTITSTGNGGYVVGGTHVYNTAGASLPISVTISGAGLATPYSVSGSAVVTSAGVTATLASMTSTEGQVFSGTVATFTDADSNTTTLASAYTATITWPGGGTSAGTITAGTGGTYTVTGSFTFNHAGPQPVSISITGPGMASPATATGNAGISTAGLSATLATITAAEGGTFTGTLATFTDADASTTSIATDYAVAIAWNGGTPIAGTIVALGNGAFAVTSSETFTAAGSPSVAVDITGPGGGLAFATGTASVTSGTLSATASTVTAAEGVAFNGTVATFSDSYATTNLASAFTASINWGDSATSAGTVTALGNGEFSVTAAHTYTAPGSPTVGISITGPGGGSATASTTATVSAAAITASNSAITSTEGQAWSGVVATFHSADTASTVLAGQYSATITWPDGSTSGGTVIANGGGVYTVDGSFTFHTAGSQSVQVAITGPGSTTSSANDTATIASAGITATLAPITSTEGTAFSGAVATFTDADPLTTTPASAYSATITWAGGATSSGTIAAGTSGSYTITGSHTFDAAGSQPVSISITGPGGAAATASGAAGISSAGVNASLATISTTEGTLFSGTVATFTDADAQTTTQPGDYTALITWAGNAPVHGTITSLGSGEFAVSGSFTFTAAGNQSVAVAITGPANSLAFANGTAAVASGTLSATATPITDTEGFTAGGTIATFTDSYTGTTTPGSAFSATITWGDGQSMNGIVNALGNGEYSVGGVHLYTAPGSYTVGVSITGPGGGSATASTSATVSAAALSAAPSAITATQGAAWTGTIATITDADVVTTIPASALSATITWPDNTTSVGTITETSTGVYVITGSFTFQAAGSQSVQVAVTGPGSTSASTTATATVASAAVNATMALITATEGTPWTGTVATFANADTLTTTPASAYTATITWDNTTTSVGTITTTSSGQYAVTSTHTFNTPGVQSESISITGPGMATPATSTRAETIASAGVTVTGGSIAPTEGTSFSGAVATFTDANASTTLSASAYTAHITWDDNTTSVGTITANGAGAYTISAQHTFHDAGAQTYSISVTNGGLVSAATGAGSATVANGGISGSLSTISATEGSVFTGAIATFHDADPLSTVPAGSYSATITWNDNTTSPGTIAATSNGTYSITATHTFHTAGSDVVAVSVTGPGVASPLSLGGNATVASAGITATLATITAAEGGTFSGAVGTFTDSDPLTTTSASAYSATITWPGGTTSLGTITATTNGSYAVTGSFTFNAAGSQPVSFSVTGPGGAAASATGNAGISSAGLSASLATITGTEGGTFSGTVATFTDANATTTSTPANYTALITWAGGTPVAGTITSLGNGAFAVSGSNTFTAAGAPTVSVAITGPANGLAFASGAAAVTSGALSATAAPIAAAEGTSFSGTIATFSDAYTATTTPASAFTATITWGDNATSTGIVTALGNGQFAVTSSHTYTAPGSPAVGISITGPGGGSATASTTATVSAASLTATASAISATLGTAWTGNVATISIADLNTTILASSLTATITWPGGSMTPGTITALGGGQYSVTGAFTFTSPGPQTVSVAITGPGNTSALVTDSAAVATSGILASLTEITATEGTGWTGQIASFSVANAAATASQFTASIHWEDNTTTTGLVLPDSAGGFDVEASHTFAHSGFAPVSVSISGPNSSGTTVSGFEKVTSATITPASQPLAPTEGVEYSGALATFADPNTLASAGDFTATVTWPDNSTSAGTVKAGSTPGSFVVTSPHVFAHSGDYPVGVTITTAGGFAASITDTAAVGNAALASSASTVTATAGSAFSGTVATFSDANLAASNTDFLATVNFGDGSAPIHGTIASLGNGKFSVTGAHTYTRFGSYPISVAVSGAGGGTTSASGAATVANASLASSGVTIVESKGVGFTTLMGVLYSANPYLKLADMTGTINWGDKLSSSVILGNDPAGGYEILGSHTYAALGKFNVSISLSEAGGGATSVTSFVTVNAVSGKPHKVGKTPKPKKPKAPKPVKTKAPKVVKTKKEKNSDESDDTRKAA